MPTIYLTPASISYLNQLLLTLVITAYLGWRLVVSRNSASRQDVLLILFFATMTVFSLSLFLEASLLPSERLIAVYLESLILGVLLVVLIQFAYTTAPAGKLTGREPGIYL